MSEKASAHLIRWAMGGVLYGLLEILWRGHTHWTMMLLAAILCIPLDIANEHIPLGIPSLASGSSGRHRDHRGGAGGRAGAQCLARPWHLGLLRAFWKSMGPDLPSILGAVVSAGRAGDRCV